MTKESMKNKVAVMSENVKGNISKALIQTGLKKESREVLEMIEHKSNIILKKDFDVVYACIEKALTPTDLTAAENMILSFSQKHVHASEGSLLDAAIQIKYKELFVGLYDVDFNSPDYKSSVRKLDDLTLADYHEGIKNGIIFSNGIKQKLGVA